MPTPLWHNMQGSGVPAESCNYAVGDTVVSGTERGRVVALGGSAGYETIAVEWTKGQQPIKYPADAPYLRRAMPWEI